MCLPYSWFPPGWCLLRKSKPHTIKLNGFRKPALGLLLLLSLPAAAMAERKAAPKPVLSRISSDTTSTPGAQHATEVEPDAFASGSTVVATFQVGRFFAGSAGAIGFATSTNAGGTWRSGLLPAVTQGTSPPGPAAARSAPGVASPRP